MKIQTAAGVCVVALLGQGGCELVERANCEIYSSRVEAEGHAFRLSTPDEGTEVRFAFQKTDSSMGINDGPNFPQFDFFAEEETDWVFGLCLAPWEPDNAFLFGIDDLQMVLKADGEFHELTQSEDYIPCWMRTWEDGNHFYQDHEGLRGALTVEGRVIKPQTLSYQLTDNAPPKFDLVMEGPDESGETWRLELEAKTSLRGNSVTCD